MEAFGKLVLILILIVIIVLVFSYPFMLLWNELMPKIFGLMKIDLWQSLGLLVLSGMLFGKININKE